ncbi:hypothetical protein CRYUN_Cryun12cG0146100 [Craigia yunnanensis]
MFCLTIPKRTEENDENANVAAEENAQEELINDENQSKHDEGHGHDENEEQSKKTDDYVLSVHKEMRKKGSILERTIELKNNIVLTVVLAFSLGVFSVWKADTVINIFSCKE